MCDKSILFLVALTIPALSLGQETDGFEVEREADGFFGEYEAPGQFSGEGSAFFELLGASYAATEVPLYFEEVLELSTVAARGYMMEVLPGRGFSHERRPQIPPIQTVLLKIRATSVLKGDAQDVYYIEFPSHYSIVDQLNTELYSRELLFLLRPASTFYDTRFAVVSETEQTANELKGQPIHSLTVQASLFTISEAGSLTSPINISQEFNHLYEDVTSLDQLASEILEMEARIQ